MDIAKLEEAQSIEPGEITTTLKKEYPKFSKTALSLARHSKETGVTLTPKAQKILKAKYVPPIEAKPKVKRVSFPIADEELLRLITEDAEKANCTAAEIVLHILTQWYSKVR